MFEWAPLFLAYININNIYNFKCLRRFTSRFPYHSTTIFQKPMATNHVHRMQCVIIIIQLWRCTWNRSIYHKHYILHLTYRSLTAQHHTTKYNTKHNTYIFQIDCFCPQVVIVLFWFVFYKRHCFIVYIPERGIRITKDSILIRITNCRMFNQNTKQ